MHQHRTLFAAAALLGALAAFWYACGGRMDGRFFKAEQLSSRLNTAQLTPLEIKRLEHVINTQVSPCGDDVTLAESLFNPERCPLSPIAADFVVKRVMEDYNEEEITKLYTERYASLKGLEIPKNGSPELGASSPVATIAIFSDFECSHCVKRAEELHDMVRRFPDKIAILAKHYPLAQHPTAELAARAAIAAHRQGKFWQMHDTLFSTQGSELTRERIDIIAEGLGLDMKRFGEDLASASTTAVIEADKQLGQQLGVDSTPTIFINGRELGQGQDLAQRIREEFMRADILSGKAPQKTR